MSSPFPYLDIKEHVAITVFSTTAAESALAISIFAADELFYSIEVSLISCLPYYSLTLLFFSISLTLGLAFSR
jgi:hypothetical protein